MAFNSDTYHANKTAREAWGYLAKARACRQRVAAGTPELLDTPERVGFLAGCACLYMRIAIGFRRSAAEKKDYRKGWC